MTRAELIRRFVLNTICDDYEDIERIQRPVQEKGSACGITITDTDILKALRELIELGYAKAWDLSQWADPPPPPPDDIEPKNPGFKRTKEGMAFQRTGIFDEDLLSLERREQFVRSFILNSYGPYTHLSLGSIELLWSRLPDRHGVNISRAQFVRALRQLVELGYLEACYTDEYRQYDGMPPLEDIKPFGAYFWVTGTGWDFLQSDKFWWRCEDDDDGELHVRKDWTPPNA